MFRERKQKFLFWSHGILLNSACKKQLRERVQIATLINQYLPALLCKTTRSVRLWARLWRDSILVSAVVSCFLSLCFIFSVMSRKLLLYLSPVGSLWCFGSQLVTFKQKQFWQDFSCFSSGKPSHWSRFAWALCTHRKSFWFGSNSRNDRCTAGLSCCTSLLLLCEEPQCN